MEKKGFPLLSLVCLGAALLYLAYATIGLFQDHYIGEHFKKAMDLQYRLQVFSSLIPFSMQLFQYKALRKGAVYFAWLLFSLVLIAIQFAFYTDRSLIVRDNLSAVNGFKSLFVFLLWFQGCRLLSKRLYGVELVLPTRDAVQRKINNRPYDSADKRYLTVLDYIALVGGWVVIIVSNLN